MTDWGFCCRSTFDLADHYGDAEEFVGTYAHFPDKDKHWRVGGTNYLTKWVPRPGPMTMEVVRAAVQVSIDRMKTPETQKIDLMQFHWWDYSDNRCERKPFHHAYWSL